MVTRQEIKKRMLGKTQLKISRLGFGSAQLGLPGVTKYHADHLLNGLLDTGINLFCDGCLSFLTSLASLASYNPIHFSPLSKFPLPYSILAAR